ncbi:MAG: TIR domain-containing protein [Treponema sp.]|nr:TIR domain-containing protein [Treponema sp.]
MPYLPTYKLFISHAWDYHDDYIRLVNLLKEANYFNYANYSVPKDDSFGKMTIVQLKEEIRQQIRLVNCFLALGGVYMSYSDWIQFELDFAVSLDKPIIGIKPWGNTNVSTAVSDVSKEVVGWNTDSIIAAIRKYSI